MFKKYYILVTSIDLPTHSYYHLIFVLMLCYKGFHLKIYYNQYKE